MRQRLKQKNVYSENNQEMMIIRKYNLNPKP